MNPQNSRALTFQPYCCILQLVSLITLATASVLVAHAELKPVPKPELRAAANTELRTLGEPQKPAPLMLSITPTTLPDGHTQAAYKAYLQAQGGSGQYQFYRVNGSLPPGLSLRRNGELAGRPRNAGLFSFRVLVTDLPQGDRGEATLSLNIATGTQDSGSPIGVSISPLGPTVNSEGAQQFSATVSNTSNTAVAWSSSAGSISTNGMFTAPKVTSAMNVMVQATSMADASKSAATSVIVSPPATPPSVGISVSPTSIHVASGSTQQFSATVSNTSNAAVTWSASKGSVSSTGMFTAPNVASSTNVIITATSAADPSKSAQASVTVDALAGVAVSITPLQASLAPGATQQFSSTVSNSSNTTVSWSASKGTISASGLFTAPSVTTATNVIVVATSVADPTRSAQSSVSVSPLAPVSISIAPKSVNVASGSAQQFSATVSNASNTAVTWSTSSGTISANGLFTAPTVSGTTQVTVQATSLADSTQSAQASVTITASQPPPPPPPAGGSADNTYCGAGDVANFGSNDGPAQLPQTCFYTATSATPSPGQVTFVPSGSNLQSVLSAANCGDVIQLQAGGTFSALQVPAKGCDDNHWITIETSGIASLP
ncbi:MAG: hypothetical protein JO356_17915, partial [Acidobacteria bacterium]|nr:hypothetical protein [Acidobacteriota bacterium]